MTLVLDSSSLIALSRIGRLEIVHQLFGEVEIAAAVFEEVVTRTEKVGAAELRELKWLRVASVVDREAVDRLRTRLGLGEAESIVLARQLSADFVVLDDAAARRAAEEEEVRVIGLLGILVVAKERGILEALSPLLQELKAAGFYISDSLCREVLRRVGETGRPVADPPDDLNREE